MKKNLFVTYAVTGMVITFICGVDSLFENPFGLIAFSAILGTIIAAILMGVYTIAEKMSPEKTKKFVKTWLTPEE